MAAPKVIFVTGGNNGVGFEIVKAFLNASKSYHIILGSRSLEKARLALEKLHKDCPAATNTVEVAQIDLNSDDSIDKAFEQVQANPGRLDVLINNAGATFDIEFLRGNVSIRECFTKAYDVNVAGTNVVTWKFVPLLLKSLDPRLIFVSGMSQMTQASVNYFPTPPQPAGWPKNIDFETIGYRCSKTALNMLMLDWNHKLKADGVKVWSVSPGFVETDLGGIRQQSKAMGAGDPAVSGQLYLKVVEGERDADVGKLVRKDGLSTW